MKSSSFTVYSQPSFPLNPSRTALIIVDMQNEFLREGGAVYIPDTEKCIENHQKLIRECREKKIPIFYIKYITPPVPTIWREFASTFTEPPLKGCWKGFKRYFSDVGKKLDVTDIIHEIYPESEDYVVEKNWFDSFWASPLESYLRALKIKHVIITGVVTEVCVEATAKGAYFRNFYAVVVSDAVSSATPKYHNMVLELLGKRWARVVNTEEVISEIREH
jgi:nicotinamidase-related amidase